MCFGIKLPENFDYPYITKSVGEFWRRWHITLSSWFRDYMFYPLERARRGKAYWSQHLNVILIFLVTGLWHGFTLNFLVWGGIHGVAIALENAFLGKLLKKLPGIVQQAYAVAVVGMAWIFFRASEFAFAINYIRSMFNPNKVYYALALKDLQPIEGFTWFIFAVGVIFSFPVIETISSKLKLAGGAEKDRLADKLVAAASDAALLLLFGIAMAVSFGGTFSTFLYENF
jgi:alginate O-acetyltransferase complex protein AlgI